MAPSTSSQVTTVYTDLDGTLLGPGGALLADADGPSLTAASALVEMARAGIELVLVSGRTRAQVREVARLVSARAFIVELGGQIVYREHGGEVVVWNEGARRGAGLDREGGSGAEAIHRSGAAGFLLETYSGRLEPHTPWSYVDRECSVLFRGLLDLDEARSRLAAAGYGWVDLLDNGIVPAGRERFPALDVEEVRAYHLLPAGVSKRSAVRLDRARRGLARDVCVYFGDSVSDAEVAPEVRTLYLVANAAPAIAGIDLADNVYVTAGSYGAGFAEAVLSLLAPAPHEAATGYPPNR